MEFVQALLLQLAHALYNIALFDEKKNPVRKTQVAST